MSIDLDAIEAALVPQYDQYGRGANDWHINIEVRARTEWLPALVTELRATTADLAVAVEVARERGKEVERLKSSLASWELEYPCDGMCSPTSGPEEDCSRHGRPPRDLWDAITAKEKRIELLTSVAEAARVFIEAWERSADDVRVAGDLHAALDALDAGGEES